MATRLAHKKRKTFNTKRDFVTFDRSYSTVVGDPDQYSEEFFVHKDTESERILRELSTSPDRRRPTTEHYLENFYVALKDTNMTPTAKSKSAVVPHSDLFYARAMLEDKFPDRLFTLDEVAELIKEVYDVTY